jgi:hypothetical protein
MRPVDFPASGARYLAVRSGEICCRRTRFVRNHAESTLTRAVSGSHRAADGDVGGYAPGVRRFAAESSEIHCGRTGFVHADALSTFTGAAVIAATQLTVRSM